MSSSNIHFENKSNVSKSISTQVGLYAGFSVPATFTVVQQNTSGATVSTSITPRDSGVVKVGFEASDTSGALFRFSQSSSAGIKALSVRLLRNGGEIARWTMNINVDDVQLFPEIFQFTDTGATVGASNSYQYEFQVPTRDANTGVTFNHMNIVATEVK